MIGTAVGLAESFNPIALIGTGGIGKTSVALAVLHRDRIKRKFGDNRRFIRCDQFPASRTSFLSRLSKVIGAGVENPEDLGPLRPFLSSKEMFIVLDNAESILDPRGAGGQEIYGVVEELSQFDNVCLFITSRITTVPPDCKCLDVPTLSLDAAHSTFYRIYDNDKPSGPIDRILEQLDCHPLSITLLATVAHQNKWDNDRLVREWEQNQTSVLRTEHNKSLAATIELSLASPMFQELGPDARELLGVVAFFPQGVGENSLNWLFSAVPDRNIIFDKLCVLSLTYRINGFVRMLAPLRDYLSPKDPTASPLLRTAKELYSTRLSVIVDPDVPGFEDTRWIISEDVNVEHLLNVFASPDPDSVDIWDTCNGFLGHLYWHKPRHTVLGPKIESLPDDHRWKPRSLLELSQLVGSSGDHVEEKRLLTQALKLWRERKDDYWVARTLRQLAEANRILNLREEGVQQAKESLEICERLGDMEDQAWCLIDLARLLLDLERFDAAEEAITRSINLLEKGQKFPLCRSHRILGDIYRCKREREKAIYHYGEALGIASTSNWGEQLFWIHFSLAMLFFAEDDLEGAYAHVSHAQQHVGNNAYSLGRAMEMQARIFYRQSRPEDATSAVLCAIEIFEKLGAAKDLEHCRGLLRDIK